MAYLDGRLYLFNPYKDRGENKMALSILDIIPKNVIDPKTSEDFELSRHKGNLADGTVHTFSDTELRTLHSMFQRWGTSGLDASQALDNFNRFYSVFPDMEMPTDLKSYVFFTRPEMNLVGGSTSLSNQPTIRIADDNKHDTRLQYLAAMNPEIMYMLTEDYSNEHQFIPYLQSRAESLQIPDYQIRTSEFTVPFFSYKFTYPTVTNESITGGTFDVTFREDSELRITKLFQFWIYYMDAIMKDKMKPSRTHILDNSYDFMCSVYEIITDPTSEKILFWAKYTGCFPTSVPLSNLSHNLRSTVENKVSVQFSYMMVEAMEPRVIMDFNNNSTSATNYAPIYDESFGMVGESLVGSPRIVPTTDQHGLLLKWNTRKKGKTSSLSNSIPTLTNISKSLSDSSIERSYDSTAVTAAINYAGIVTQLSKYLNSNSDTIFR